MELRSVYSVFAHSISVISQGLRTLPSLVMTPTGSFPTYPIQHTLKLLSVIDRFPCSTNLDTCLPAPENLDTHWKSIRSWPLCYYTSWLTTKNMGTSSKNISRSSNKRNIDAIREPLEMLGRLSPGARKGGMSLIDTADCSRGVGYFYISISIEGLIAAIMAVKFR